MLRRSTRALALVASVACLAPAAGAATAEAATTSTASSCAVRWGSLLKGVGLTPVRVGPVMASPRTGHHTCYDRAVFDVKGSVGSVVAAYETSVNGTSFLTVAVRHDTANPSATPAILYGTGLRTISGYGASEWSKTAMGYSLETRARLPFRLFVIKGPGATSRVVVDVAHHW